MKRILLTLLAGILLPASAEAGRADNIEACAAALRDHADREVSPFDAQYDGNFVRYSAVEWPGIACEVKLGTVFNLTVDGRTVIVDRFAGPDAKALHERLELETGDAINVLENRIRLLESRMSDAEERLRAPTPDLGEVEGFVRGGIEQAL